MQQSLVDPVVCEPSTGPSAGRRLRDSHWDVSDAHHPGRSSAKSEARYTHSITSQNYLCCEWFTGIKYLVQTVHEPSCAADEFISNKSIGFRIFDTKCPTPFTEPISLYGDDA